jgi:hypothetical protein
VSPTAYASENKYKDDADYILRDDPHQTLLLESQTTERLVLTYQKHSSFYEVLFRGVYALL